MSTSDKSMLTLTAEEFIKDAVNFINMTLNGLAREYEYRVELINHYSATMGSYVTIKIPGLVFVDAILEDKFKDYMEAAKALAMLSVNFAVHYADSELLTRPDEQGWMHKSIAYWHELKDNAFIYKNKYLVTAPSYV